MNDVLDQFSDRPKYLDKKFSVDDRYKNFLRVQPLEQPEDLPFDPYTDAARIALAPWREKFGASTIIWDTGSECFNMCQRWVSMTGKGGADGPTYGDPDDPMSAESYKATRWQDYQDGQGQTLALMKLWARAAARQNMHMIMIGHRAAQTDSIKRGKELTIVTNGYGVDMPGQKYLLQTSKYFEEYLWMSDDGYDEPEITLHLRSDGKHQTKFRSMSKDVETSLPIPFDYDEMVEVHRKMATWRGIDFSDPQGRRYSMCLYGNGGTGKTTLATSLPPEVFEQGPVVYVAYDPASFHLSSTWPQLLEENTK